MTIKRGFAALFFSVLAGQGGAQDVQTFGNEAKTGHVEGVSLLPLQKSGYLKFRRSGGYFGAIYVNTETDAGFYVSGFHDLAKAHSAAKKGCSEFSRGEGTCVLYAVTLPKEMPFDTVTAAGMGQESYQAYMNKYLANKETGHRAFAISGASQYGLSYGWDDAAEARETALAYCEAAVAKELAGLNIEGRRWAKAHGLTKCRIVDEAQN